MKINQINNYKFNRNQKQNIRIPYSLLFGKDLSPFDADLDACGLFLRKRTVLRVRKYDRRQLCVSHNAHNKADDLLRADCFLSDERSTLTYGSRKFHVLSHGQTRSSSCNRSGGFRNLRNDLHLQKQIL